MNLDCVISIYMGDVMRYALKALNAFVFKRLIMSRIWLSLAGIEGCTC